MNKLQRICATLVLAFITVFANAQTPNNNDVMRSNGKIYVVMAVVIIIMVGLFIYLISVDRKLRKLENKS
ncbi:CcmD family protein [Parasediminibacterium paludis]|uniref:CcmD family protein n=1 Tax=Parasediminibacterium paludis TaxID=908966 RepID=A0ABV8PQ61_9BACT